jgi:hypothetical protein
MRPKISRKIRKKLNRSNTYPCDVCHNTEILVEHHIEGREINNPNHPSNLTNICGNCHNRIHNGIIIIEGWFGTSNGKELLWHHYKSESFSGKAAKTHLI